MNLFLLRQFQRLPNLSFLIILLILLSSNKTNNRTSKTILPNSSNLRNSNSSSNNNLRNKAKSRWIKRPLSRYCKHSNRMNKRHKRNCNDNKARNAA